MRRSTVPRAWTRLGRMLPRSIRELVFEPACLDLWLRSAREIHHERRGCRAKMWLTFSTYLIAAGCYGVPRYIVDGGRTTRFGRVLKLFAISVGVVLLIMLLPWVIDLTRL